MLILLDANAYLHRAYHVYSHLTRAHDGHPTGAVYGFLQMVHGDLDRFEYTHAAAVFDGRGGSKKRFAIHPEYKAARGERPPAITRQYPLVRRATHALGLACCEQEGWEADDLIATYAEHAHRVGLPVLILSSDKDFMQLMRDGVQLRCPIKKRTMTDADVLKKFGVTPDLVTAVQALQGDTIDNVPGVHGVGPKTAAALINATKSLREAVLACVHGRPVPISDLLRNRIAANVDTVARALELVTLDRNVPLDQPIDALVRKGFSSAHLSAFLDEMEFPSLKERLLGRVAA